MNQTVTIPEVHLIPHSSIAQVLRQCQEKNQRPNVDLFRERVEDSNFLNQLQATVNRWIREIQKVNLQSNETFVFIGFVSGHQIRTGPINGLSHARNNILVEY